MTTDPAHSPVSPPSDNSQGMLYWLGRLWSLGQFLLALAIAGGALVYLLMFPIGGHEEEDDSTKRPPAPAEITSQGLLRVPSDSTLNNRYQTAVAVKRSIRAPVLTVTGTVVASMRPGQNGKDYWQFNSPEVVTAHSDWEKAVADIDFTQTQLKRIRELAAARESAQKKLVARLETLVQAGTDTPKDLAAERANLIQMQITAQKDIHEATNAIRVAQRTEAALARQLQQNGLDPELLKKGNRDMDIVLADVPEQRLGQIAVRQACEARFFGLPGDVFSGRVTSIAPVVSKERRTLRVLFIVNDPKDQLRPGMFAEIGLGTDPRDVLMVPAVAAVHVGREDYVLVKSGEGLWRVSAVRLGETYNSEVEVRSGVKEGDTVIADGAVLLKGFILKATQGGRLP